MYLHYLFIGTGHEEVIQLTTLPENLTPVVIASVSSSESSSSILLACTYNMPKPHYVNQHMVRPVYTYLHSEGDEEHRQSAMVRISEVKFCHIHVI